MGDINARMVTAIIAVVTLAVIITVFFTSGPHNLITSMETWFGNIINGSRLTL